MNEILLYFRKHLVAFNSIIESQKAFNSISGGSRSFMHYIVTGDEIGVHKVTLEITKASIDGDTHRRPFIRCSKQCHPRRNFW